MGSSSGSSAAAADLAYEGRADIERDLAWLMDCFREVLVSNGEESVAASLPWLGSGGRRRGPAGPRSSQAVAIAFRLLNLVEEIAAARWRRRAEHAAPASSERGLWVAVLRDLIEDGVPADEIAARLGEIAVEPVLTAHPTEAKRATVLEHSRALFELLMRQDRADATPGEAWLLRTKVGAVLERLWRTGDIFLEKPDLASELRNVAFYLREAFPEVLSDLDLRLEAAWNLLRLPTVNGHLGTALPRLRFGTWVGGDRDGHPYVTADVTAGALAALREQALAVARGRLGTLAARLSLSDQLQTPPRALGDRIEALRASLGARGDAAIARNPNEPWRQFVNLMAAALPDPAAAGTYVQAAELADDLRILFASLETLGAHRLAIDDVRPALRTVETFGFHLASLDIRQNSVFHEKAIAQLLEAAGEPDADFASWDEPKRRAFLDAELQSPRPFARPDAPLGPEAAAVTSCFRVLARHVAAHGTAGLGALIVSMTRSVSDLLVVGLFAREAGLLQPTPRGPALPLPVVPLFETIADLEQSPAILAAYLDHPLTQASLALQAGGERPVQQAMVGYSDSNKDGGICASLWTVHRAQEALARTGAQRGVRIRFFHGRGGTISRGAGPAGRFVRSLPRAALQGDLRLTEQGETIAQKYANRPTALYNLELLVAGVASAALARPGEAVPPPRVAPALDRLAQTSRLKYQELLAVEGFLDFYAQATPIDVIEQSRIGSRPSRRTGQRTFADLRAIPWVFSWSQARYYLSGWFGMGTALQELAQHDPEGFAALVEHHKSWPTLHYITANVATSVATADAGIMTAYAELVSDAPLRRRMLDRILAEHRLADRMLQQLYGGPLASSRPHVHQALSLRHEALLQLHDQQIELLKRWRAEPAATPRWQTLLSELLLSVNAIASGLRTTG